MLHPRSIVSTLLPVLAAALAMAGCGQKGNLYLPNTPEAAHRATLPQTLLGPVKRRLAPASAASAASATPAPAASAAAAASLPAPADQ